MQTRSIESYLIGEREGQVEVKFFFKEHLKFEMHLDALALNDVEGVAAEFAKAGIIANTDIPVETMGTTPVYNRTLKPLKQGGMNSAGVAKKIEIWGNSFTLRLENVDIKAIGELLAKSNIKQHGSHGGATKMRIFIDLLGKLMSASNNRLALGVVKANVRVRKSPDGLVTAMKSSIANIQKELKDIATVPVKAVRDTYKALGKNPKEFQGSNEALLRRIQKGQGLYYINSVVEANNWVSVTAQRSIGSYDVANLQGDVVFRVGVEGETYPSTKKRAIDLSKLPLLADQKGAFGSPTSDSERALITENTRQLMSVIFSFDGTDKLQDQLDEFKAHLVTYADATDVETHVLTKDKPEAVLTFNAPSADVHNIAASNSASDIKSVATTSTGPGLASAASNTGSLSNLRANSLLRSDAAAGTSSTASLTVASTTVSTISPTGKTS